MNKEVMDQIALGLLRAARTKRTDQRSSGRTTRHALRGAMEAIDFAGHGAVKMFDHAETPEACAELANKVSLVLSALGVEHIVEGALVTVKPIEPRKDESRQGSVDAPKWAVAKNASHALVPGAKLLSKDERFYPDAWVLSDDTGGSFCVQTETGKHLHLTGDEIQQRFTVGDWIVDLDEIAMKFGK